MNARRVPLLRRVRYALGGNLDLDHLISELRAQAAREHLENDSLAMIEGVLRISERQVRDIMIPRSKMVVLDRDDPLDVMLEQVVESAHSRFPVIGEHRDEVVGILLAKDLLTYLTPDDAPTFQLRDVLRPAVFIPESKRLNVLLWEFRTSRNHMAIVVDEYGGVAGLVTIEDVLEQIVGRIDDEYDVDEDEELMFPNGDGSVLVHGLTPIEEFNAYFASTLADDEFDTVGGYVADLFARLPDAGESIDSDGFRFTVVSADKRRIETLRVEIVAGQEDAGAA